MNSPGDNASLGASSSSPPLDPPDDSEGGASGERIVLWVLLIISLGVVAAFAIFYGFTKPEDRAFIVPTVSRDLYTPLVVWGLLTTVDAQRKGRSWGLYLLAAPVPLLNIVVGIQWLRRWRKHPRPLGRWTL